MVLSAYNTSVPLLGLTMHGRLLVNDFASPSSDWTLRIIFLKAERTKEGFVLMVPTDPAL